MEAKVAVALLMVVPWLLPLWLGRRALAPEEARMGLLLLAVFLGAICVAMDVVLFGFFDGSAFRGALF